MAARGLARTEALKPTLTLRKPCAITLIIGLNPNLEGSIMPFCVQLTIVVLNIIVVLSLLIRR